MNHRPLRVGKLIREELGKIVLKEIEFPAGAFVTITEAEVDRKLEKARVGVSVIPTGAAVEVLTMLGENVPRLQRLLLKKINIKPMPKIYFEMDRGPENAAAVEKLLIEDNNK